MPDVFHSTFSRVVHPLSQSFCSPAQERCGVHACAAPSIHRDAAGPFDARRQGAFCFQLSLSSEEGPYSLLSVMAAASSNFCWAQRSVHIQKDCCDAPCGQTHQLNASFNIRASYHRSAVIRRLKASTAALSGPAIQRVRFGGLVPFVYQKTSEKICTSIVLS